MANTAMALQPDRHPCPACKSSARFVKSASDLAIVDYYRCDHGHVWSVSKRDGTITFVTPDDPDDKS